MPWTSKGTDLQLSKGCLSSRAILLNVVLADAALKLAPSLVEESGARVL